MKILEELKNLTDRFDRDGIDYALCGGLALAVYEMPRATLDIDLMIEPNMLERVQGLAGDLGFTLAATPMEFKGGQVQIHRLTKIDPISHEVLVLDLMIVTDATRRAWESRWAADWRGGRLKIVSPEGMIALKSLRNSDQDRQDIAYLRSLDHEA